MKKYDTYKPSGVEWLGEIPEHWELTRLGSILNPISNNNRTDLPLLSITREKAVILRDLDNEEENHNYIPDDLSNYKVLLKGQFGMNKMKAWQGSYGVSDYDGIVSPAYFVFDLNKKIDPKYFHVSIRSKLYVSFFGSASDGVRIGQWDLSKPRMKEIPFLIPSLTEQTAIANFLDDKTTKIDQAIAIKEQQIALLKERKQIIIQEAVTKGLDKTVKLKDSGVEWIGEIPEHWEVLDIRRITSEHKQGYYSTESYVDNGIKLLRITDFRKNGNLDTSDCPKVREVKEVYNYLLSPGDFVFARTGGAGNFAVFKESIEKIAFASYLIRFRFNLKIISIDYLKFYFTSPVFIYGIERNIHGGVNQNIHAEDIKSQKIPIPPISEQISISKDIEFQFDKMDQAISIKEQEIEKLKEYKVSLIDGVVTGKVRVC